MQVAVSSDSQISNLIKFLELNNGEKINLTVRKFEYNPGKITDVVHCENIEMTSKYSEKGLWICDKWFIPKKEIRTLGAYEDSLYSFVMCYRNDEEEIHYNIYVWNVNRRPFNRPSCTNFFRDDKDYEYHTMEVMTKSERLYYENNGK